MQRRDPDASVFFPKQQTGTRAQVALTAKVLPLMLGHALRRRGGVPRHKSLKRYGRARGNTTHMFPAFIRVVVKN
jgi:hypothetical protein